MVESVEELDDCGFACIGFPVHVDSILFAIVTTECFEPSSDFFHWDAMVFEQVDVFVVGGCAPPHVEPLGNSVFFHSGSKWDVWDKHLSDVHCLLDFLIPVFGT